jgi:hypothetical protein
MQIASHKTTNNTTPHSDNEIIKNTKEKFNLCENHLSILKEEKKRCRGVILGKKWPKITTL